MKNYRNINDADYDDYNILNYADSNNTHDNHKISRWK